MDEILVVGLIILACIAGFLALLLMRSRSSSMNKPADSQSRPRVLKKDDLAKSAPRRILFPFIGPNISTSVLEATLRLARVEHATLIPAYVVTVPMHLSLSAPLAQECEVAMPLLEVVEQRAAKEGVTVDSRIETGRTPRHALRRLLEEEKFDRLVIPAANGTLAGFDPDDVAWLLENASGEILVLRPERHRGAKAEPVPVSVQ